MTSTTSSTGFHSKQAYAVQEEVFFDDGREIQLLHYIYSRPDLSSIRGSPAAVLSAIDDYGHSKKYLMNVGHDKGKIVTDLIASEKPETMVELGGYVGYSAIYFGEALRAAGGKRFWSVEMNPEFAAVIVLLVDLAGLSDIVQVVVGASGDSLKRLHEEKQLLKIDFLFLDHIKPAYTPDLKLCEELGLVRQGAVLAADNVIKPGNPPYLEYVRSSTTEKRARFDRETDSKEPKGNPRLIYESGMINSYEPTGIPDGVEVTRCVGEEK